MDTTGQIGADESHQSKSRESAVKRRKVLAISSTGGHWIQLLRLRPAFRDVDVTFVTTNPDSKSMVDGARFYVVCPATRKNRFQMLLLIAQLFWILLRERPTAVVTTGAAPGYIALRIGKLLGAKTLWIDSIANAEELSLSGKLASKHSDVVLTQWAHLASPGSVECRGAVI
jgi:UDP-N-acetylglucosamine:LPS N-acetylglucosamine transferase